MATTRQRVYQAWKGRNIFLLKGRLIFGPDARSVAITVLLILIPSVIFCTSVARNLADELPPTSSLRYAIPAAAILFTIYVLVLLFLTSSRDPGIVPRNTHPPEDESFYDPSVRIDANNGRQTPTPRLPRTKEVLVNGLPVKVKYCETCMLYRPPRCSHCSVCDNCVERFDHHCPWRNYRHFFLFVSSSAFLCIYVFAMSAWNIKFLMNQHVYLWRAMRESPASVVLMIYCFIFLWFVGGLTCFHLYLISRNQVISFFISPTTYENFRYGAMNRVNVYNKGCLRNFLEVFCSKTKPSRINFRAYVQEEQQTQQQQQQYCFPAMQVREAANRENGDGGDDRRVKVEDNLEIDKDFMKISERHIAIEDGV
ncbi:unnamed protein product [Linum tenue]|uniref:S-acyltransferase n=1 Tax=Linum tenue TaxID=586396 RepID=A0AAV0L2A9_9ROSI|nr:unnamed protein product [Linum tenue]